MGAAVEDFSVVVRGGGGALGRHEALLLGRVCMGRRRGSCASRPL